MGTRTPERMYTGNAGLAQFTVSYSVRCAVDHYGADCTRECTNFVSCEGCSLPGLMGEFCQSPANNCDEAYCNGNGECMAVSPYSIGVDCSGNGRCEDGISSFVCMCEPGFTGDLCEVDINECEGVNCSTNGSCEDMQSEQFHLHM